MVDMGQFVIRNAGSVIEVAAIISDKALSALGFRIADKIKKEEKDDRENFERISIQGRSLFFSCVQLKRQSQKTL